ncbi:hypothetical protein [Paenibacillus naphthalenovorans]|uniref:hypothetical protein n=1 Tax=Paenibacillus naphthalenovorans TaxID=162209 RepID=UPI003D268CCD
MNKLVKIIITLSILLHISVPFVLPNRAQAQVSEDTIQNVLSNVTISNEPYLLNGYLNISYPQNISEDIEFRFWENLNYKEWVIVSDFDDGLLQKYQFKTTGSINLQIDARSKSNPSKIYQRWLGQYQVNTVDTNDKLISHIKLSPQTQTFNVGNTLNFTLDGTEIDTSQAEIMLWEKFGNEDWQISQSYTKWPLKSYEFTKPGKYNLQIDIRNPSNPQKVYKKWLGEFIVLKPEDNIPFIRGKNWFPFTVSPLLGSYLNLQVFPINANDYEYMLWTKHNDEPWIEAVPFQSSPTITLFLDRLGLYSLQIDVRKKAEPWIIQKYYVGQFYVHDRDREKHSDYLVRRLLSFYSSPVLNDREVLESISFDLNVALNMLIWENKNESLSAQVEKLQGLESISDIKKIEDNIIEFKVNGNKRYVNLISRTYSDGISSVIISNGANSNINQILNQSKADDKNVLISKLITYLIYVHYDYSQVPNEIDRPRKRLYSTIATCQQLAEDVVSILKTLGYSAKMVGVISKDASHAVSEVVIDNKKYTLDPSAGVVFSKSLDELKDKYELPYMLPQVRDLDILWKKQTIDKIQSLHYYE